MADRDRVAVRELRGFLEKLESDGPVFLDAVGPAIYQLEPTPRTAILCHRCHYIGLVMSVPIRSLTWRCPRCGDRVLLIPPAAILEAPRPEHPNPRLAPRRAH